MAFRTKKTINESKIWNWMIENKIILKLIFLDTLFPKCLPCWIENNETKSNFDSKESNYFQQQCIYQLSILVVKVMFTISEEVNLFSFGKILLCILWCQHTFNSTYGK